MRDLSVVKLKWDNELHDEKDNELHTFAENDLLEKVIVSFFLWNMKEPQSKHKFSAQYRSLHFSRQEEIWTTLKLCRATLETTNNQWVTQKELPWDSWTKYNLWNSQTHRSIFTIHTELVWNLSSISKEWSSYRTKWDMNINIFWAGTPTFITIITKCVFVDSVCMKH